MFHNYPYTDYHELNLDYIMKLCRENVGLALNVQGDKLRLINANGDVVSSVTVSYAEKALSDKNGKDIDTYIFSAGTSGDTIVFTHGDNTISSVTVPYATKAEKDVQNKDILDYVYAVQVAGDKLRITKGDTTITELTVPYATKASTDANGKVITTYGAALAAEGNKITLRDATGTLINEITVPYATKAGLADEATHALDADDALHADDADHADEADLADLATLATNCTNAVQTVAVSGDQLVFTTYGGQTFNITSPYSIKAQKDDLGNTIKTTYICNVTQNSGTGKLSFLDALGNTVVELTPVAGTAINDNYGNLIADFVKSIVVSQNSNYVTVTHGTGATDTLTIHYAETAWKDTNDNVIKNTYVKYMECVEDVDDGHWKLVAYNGDTPMAELFRFEVYAYAAQCDVNGKALTSYVADVDINANKEVVVKDGEGNTLNTFDTIKNALNADTAINAQKDINNKNITSYIGSIDTSSEAPRILSKDGTGTVVDSIEVPQIQVYVSSSVDPWTMNNTSFSASQVDINYSDGYLVLQTISDDAEVVLSYNTDMYFAKAKSQYPDANGRTHTIFESELTSSGVWQIDLVTTSMGAFHSCTGNVISAGGGGGGSSNIPLFISSTNSAPYNKPRFDQLGAGNSYYLIYNTTALTPADIASEFANGASCYIQDSTGSIANILHVNKYNGDGEISFMLYITGSTVYKLYNFKFYTLNGKYQIDSIKTVNVF